MTKKLYIGPPPYGVLLKNLLTRLTKCYTCIANIKVSTFHNLNIIANAVIMVMMGLYNRSAILDMQIS